MSHPREADHVKLISSLFSPEKEFIDTVIKQLQDICGPVDWVSPELLFDRTTYYAEEMGWPLHRRFISFKDLVLPGQLQKLVETFLGILVGVKKGAVGSQGTRHHPENRETAGIGIGNRFKNKSAEGGFGVGLNFKFLIVPVVRGPPAAAV